MQRTRRIILLLCTILCALSEVCGEVRVTKDVREISVDFRVNRTAVDLSYSENDVRVREIVDYLRALRGDSAVSLTSITFCGAASPEGGTRLNRRLARERLASLERIVRREIALPDSIVKHNDSYIPWEYLKECVPSFTDSYRDTVVSILEETPQSCLSPEEVSEYRIAKLKSLDGGRVWRKLNRLYFSGMRHAYAVFETVREEPVKPEPAPIPEPVPVEEPEFEPVVLPVPVPEPESSLDSVPEEDRTRHLYVKSNAAALLLAQANLACEVDLSKHWSVTLPIYFSGWDYFTSTVKFRTFSVQPELRWWHSENNDGLFAGVHFGLAYYNYAVDGSYRYQDHNRETPAIGGGLSAGYRMPISKDHRWKVEFSAGVGVYRLHYDKFHNTDRTKDGLLAGSVKKTYFGIDQIAVSLAYTFDLDEKGGKR